MILPDGAHLDDRAIDELDALLRTQHANIRQEVILFDGERAKRVVGDHVTHAKLPRGGLRLRDRGVAGLRLLGGPLQERAALVWVEAGFGLDRFQIAALAGAVPFTDQRRADEAALEEVERAVPTLVAVDVRLGL